ncbi:MAG: 50S ribosomal protein L10 [Clostridia bacterium]|nr:50S ribosomal protein L10 [Clostridia bacterium]
MSAAKLQKQAVIDEITDKLQRAKSVVIVEYKGLTVAEDTALRNEFRKNNVDYRVLKNTLIRRAFNSLGITAFDEYLNGTTSVAFSFEDEVTAAKIVEENAKKLGDKLTSKCGYVDGEFADASKVKALASIPPRPVLLSKMLGSMMAPVSGLARVLQAIAEQKGGAAE